MSLAFSDLQDKVGGWLDVGDHNSLAGLPILTRIQEALNEALVERLTQQRWSFMVNSTPQTIVINPLQADPRTYPLPVDFYKSMYFWNVTRHSPLSEYGPDWIPSRDYSGSGLIDDYFVSSPQYGGYSLKGQNIVLTWTPTDADTIQFEYIKAPTEMVANTDIPQIPYPHSRILIYDALLEMATYDEDLDQSKVSIWRDKQMQHLNGLYEAYGQENSNYTAGRYQDWTPRE